MQKKILRLFTSSMNTVHNYSRNNYYTSCKTSAVNFSGVKKGALQKIVSSTLKNVDNIPEQINKSRADYFKKYSFTDKLLIRLGLKRDCSAQMAVFDFLGVKPYLSRDGYIAITSYGELEQIKIAKMGLDEAKVFEPVFRIRDNADFNNSSLKELKNLSHVGNNLYLKYSKIDKLGKLNFVGRHVYLNDKLAEKDFKYIFVNGCVLE